MGKTAPKQSDSDHGQCETSTDALWGIRLLSASFFVSFSEDCAAKLQLRFKQRQSKWGSVQLAMELHSSCLNSQICRVRGRVEKLIGWKQKINCIPVIILSKLVSPVDFLSSSHVALPDCEECPELLIIDGVTWVEIMEGTCSLSS